MMQKNIDISLILNGENVRDVLLNNYIAEQKISFDVKNGYGLNPDVLKLGNGDEVQIKGMSYKDIGIYRKSLKKEPGQVDHYSEGFVLSGVGGKKYLVTREVVITDGSVKGPLFRSKIVSVETWNK